MKALFRIVEECREPHPAFTLWDRARAEAVRADRLPAAILRGPEWEGRLIIVHERDIDALADELAANRGFPGDTA